MWPNAMALVLLWGTAICEKCVRIYEEDGIWNYRSVTSCFKLKTLIVKSTLSFYSYASQSQQCTRAQDRSFVSKSSRFAIRRLGGLRFVISKTTSKPPKLVLWPTKVRYGGYPQNQQFVRLVRSWDVFLIGFKEQGLRAANHPLPGLFLMVSASLHAHRALNKRSHFGPI